MHDGHVSAPRIQINAASATRLIDEIIDLGDRNSKTLGFLPYAGFRAAAAEGRIAVATNDNGALLGYCLFDLPRDVVRIVQVCISESARGTQLARALVNAVSDRHSDRLGLVLKCRSDWPADKMWSKLDFVAQTLVPGRSKEQHPLTIWWRSHGHADLFSLLQEFDADGRIAAIDSNIYSDLHSCSDRQRSEDTAIIAPLIADGALVITLLPTVLKEIYATRDTAERTRFLNAQVNYRRAETPASDDVVSALIDTIPLPVVAKDSSLRHDARLIAEAYANGAELFITRDQNAIDYLAGPAAAYGVEVLQPTEVPTYLDVEQAEQNYHPARLAETAFTSQRLNRSLTDVEVRQLLCKPRDERLPDLRSRLAELAGRSTTDVDRRVLFDGDGSLQATWATRGSSVLEVPLLRVVDGRLQKTIAAQLSRMLRESAEASELRIIRVVDPFVSANVRSVLESDGFYATRDSMSALTLPLVGDWSQVSAVAKHLAQTPSDTALAPVAELPADPSPVQSAELERQWAPAKILGQGVRTYLVPIKRPFAAALLGYPASLMSRPDDLGLSREHVYYKTPRRQTQLPARILWYVTGQVQPSVIAASRLVEEVIDSPRRLHRRYSRLGVWTRADIESASQDGRAGALRFADTEIFPTPVGLDRLRVLATKGQRLQLRSTQELDDESFKRIYYEGTKR